MELTLFLGIMAGLLTIYTIIGYVMSRSLHSSNDYLLAGKTLGVPAITATLLATQIGGGMFLGTAQNPFHGLLYIFGIVLGLLILGLGLAQKLRGFNAYSIGEIFEKTYQSPSLHHICSFLSVVAFCGILIGQISAAKSLLLTFAGIQDNLLFIIFWLSIVIYTMIGGFKTVIITDFFRIIFITIVFSGICIYSLLTSPLTFFSEQTLMSLQQLFNSSDITLSEALRMILIPAAFCIIEDDLAQKFFSAKTKATAGIAALYASFLLLLFSFIPFYFGIVTKLLQLPVTPGTSPLLPFLSTTTNSFFFTLGLCALLSAITSTTDSLLCAISAIVTTGIHSAYKIKSSVLISRTIIFCTGIATLISSYFFSESIIGLLVNSYEIALSGLLVPFLGCLFLKHVQPRAAWLSMIAGVGSFILFKIPSTVITQYAPSLKSICCIAPSYASGITFIAAVLGYLMGWYISKE